MDIRSSVPIVLGSIVFTGSCLVGPDSDCSDSATSEITFLPHEPQVLVVGERRSIWMSTSDSRESIEVEVTPDGAIRELGRTRPFGDGMVRLDIEGIRPGTAGVRARLRCGTSRRTILTVVAHGAPLCETDGPPPYCVTGRYRVRATELNDRCTGEVDTFETAATITRGPVDPIGASLTFDEQFTVEGGIGPDGVFFTEFPHPIGTLRGGRQVLLQPIAVRLAGFRVQGQLDVVGVFPSPDPVDFAPCERSWVLEGERLPPIERPSSADQPPTGSQ